MRRLSWSISSNFRENSVLKCASKREIAKNSLKPIFLGRSRSSTFVPMESSSAVLVMITSKSVSVRNRSDARRANRGKITLRGYPSLMLSFEGNLFTQRHEICSQETRDSRLSYGRKLRNQESLISPGLESVPGHDRQTDRRTDGRTDRRRISCRWVRRFPSNEGIKEEYPLRNCYFTQLRQLIRA